MEQFAENLKDLIDDTGLSLRSLEKECGISANQLSGYERGVVPSVRIAIKLAKYFDCSLDYLFGLDDNHSKCKVKSFDLPIFLKNYQNLLVKNKITHWKFCKIYQISESSLRHWKSGDVPSMANLYKIAINLGESIDNLLL